MKFDRCFGCMEEIHGYPCPVCGFDPAQAAAPNYVLPYGAILNGRYIVGKMLGQGGFGITYIGWDLAMERKVAIKEYYPSGQVSRNPGSRDLTWYTNEQSRQARQNGMQMFLKEARKMSKVDNLTNVVRVRDIFQENETAYIVMDFVEGETLKARLDKTGPLTWKQAKEIFVPAMQAMEQVHQAGLVHRDISPDNLMLTPDGRVMILDLGAAKDLAINKGASSAMVVKGGFSPPEQYAQQGGSGSWTDVYAMAATMYHSLTGVVPPTAVDRMQGEPVNWALLETGSVPNHVIAALQNAMKLNARERTQTMAELLRQCQSETAVVARKEPPVSARKGNFRIIGFAAALCLVAALAVALFVKAKPAPQPVSSPTTMQAVPTRSTTKPTEPDSTNSNQTQPTLSTPPAETSRNRPSVSVNDILTFGRYEQDGIRGNGAEDIEWLVLDVQGNKALLLSRYALDSQPYNSAYGKTTWEACTLRSWLNSTFFDAAFTAEEKASILVTEVDNGASQNNSEWHTKGCNNTEDMVFLLSYNDTDRYFDDRDARICTPTNYAVSMGADTRTLDDGVTDAAWWWLRSPGENETQASFVNFDGTRYTNAVGNGYLSVRPAIWVEIAD